MAPQSPPLELETEQQFADRWATSARHIRRLRAESGLPYRKIGSRVRFVPTEVDAWADDRAVRGALDQLDASNIRRQRRTAQARRGGRS
jgi:hypothetical protein